MIHKFTKFNYLKWVGIETMQLGCFSFYFTEGIAKTALPTFAECLFLIQKFEVAVSQIGCIQRSELAAGLALIERLEFTADSENIDEDTMSSPVIAHAMLAIRCFS